MSSQFEKTILLSIHRQYTENEAVKFLEQQLAAANIEIGKLKAEIGEVNYPLEKKIEDLKKDITENNLKASEKNKTIKFLEQKLEEKNKLPDDVKELQKILVWYQGKLRIKTFTKNIV